MNERLANILIQPNVVSEQGLKFLTEHALSAPAYNLPVARNFIVRLQNTN